MNAKIIVLALLMACASGERSIDEPVVDGYEDLSADLKIGLRDDLTITTKRSFKQA